MWQQLFEFMGLGHMLVYHVLGQCGVVRRA